MSSPAEARLVSTGNVLVDLIATVPALPARGADIRATGSSIAPGGGFNAMLAATRQGLPAVYAGGHGTGYFGDLVRAALAGAGIETLLPVTPGSDSGHDIALVDDGGERTFVTVFGAEAELTAGQVASITLRAGDLILVSGYGLLAATNGAVLAPWIVDLPASHTVLLDPGPLVGDLEPAVLEAVLGRVDWLSCNEREAMILTGEADPETAIGILSRRNAGVLVRLGAEGCLLGHNGIVERVPGYRVVAIDTNGAGDAHSGAFLAALAAGLAPREAAARANACAAIAVTRRGPATAPTLDEVLQLMSGKNSG